MRLRFSLRWGCCLGVWIGLMSLAPQQTVIDRMGRAVPIPPGGPRRIIPMVPSVAETLVWLGETKRILAVTEFTHNIPEVRDRPRVGGPFTPNIERILALRPDLVILDRHHNPRSLAEVLDRTGVPYLVLVQSSIEDIQTNLILLGRMVGRIERARQWIRQWDQLTACLQRVTWAHRPRVLFLLAARPIYTVGPGAFIYDVLVHAGLDPITQDAQRPWLAMNLEAVIQRDPEVILVPQNEHERVRNEIRFQPAWQSVQAVRTGRIVTVPERILRPSPYLIQVLIKLVKQFHSEHRTAQACFRRSTASPF